MDNENKVPEVVEAEQKEASKEESKKEQEMPKEEKKMERKKVILLSVAIAVVLVALVGYKFKGADFMTFFQHKKVLKVEEAKAKALDFIDKNLVQPGTKVDISDMIDDSGLYKMTVSVGTQKITAYMTKDGSQFFPSAMDMNVDPAAASADSTPATPAKEVPKSAKPDVKLFVMSYCPYGTQIEKGILPVVKALGSKINFSLEFVNYSMHNDLATGDRKELDENLRQYCIQKNQPTKLSAYLTCFLKVGQGTESSCMTTAGVSASQVATCMAQADTQFNVTKDFNDKSTYKGQFPMFEVNSADNDKYGVQGSPTLVINDTQVAADGRDAASLLKTICSAFTTAPKECQAQLSSTAPAAGFGEGAAAATPAGAPAANCAN